MEKEFIPYEEAKALEELGFNKVLNLGADQVAYYEKRPQDTKVREIFCNTGYRVMFNESEYTLRPLYQQAFRWFREKHKLDLVERPFKDSFAFPQITYVKDVIRLSDGRIFKSERASYEEAELACLRKLIEICQEK